MGMTVAKLSQESLDYSNNTGMQLLRNFKGLTDWRYAAYGDKP